MGPDQIQTWEAQHSISLSELRSKRGPSGSAADIARISVAGAGNTRFLRSVERQISKLAAWRESARPADQETLLAWRFTRIFPKHSSASTGCRSGNPRRPHTSSSPLASASISESAWCAALRCRAGRSYAWSAGQRYRVGEQIAHFLALIQIAHITATMYVSLGVTGMKPGALFRRISTGAWPRRCML